MTGTDRRHMAHALVLAARGLGRVWPNPSVGCVIVADGRVVGRGVTGDGGRPHAERRALDMAGQAAAQGATAYVTLEPCAHHGKTPPCAEALVDAGIARAVIAHADPDPRVAGKGIAALREAGIAVETGLLEAEARRLQSGFLSRIGRGRPMVTLKLATSLDGRIATAAGESRWITGPEARREVHAMRMRHDAVMIGAGTARADDPDLTVRDLGADRQPVRIVISRHLALSETGRLARSLDIAPLWIVHGDDADAETVARWTARGATTLAAGVASGTVDMASALRELGSAGLTRVLCEGGGSLAASLLGQGLVDDLALFTGPLALGAEGRPAVGALGLSMLSDAPRMDLVAVRSLGADTLHLYRARSSL